MSDITSNIETENIEMHAYVVMLHLVYRRYSTFIEIKDLLCLKVKSGFPQAYIKSVLANIVQTIEGIAGEWQEDIPLINAFVFKKDGGKCSSFIREKVFGNKNKQPTQQQIAEHAARIAAYSKWDEVLEVFRKKAFEVSQP